ncbi:type II toxin-antitoxin system HipA family toxin [Paracoccaceae bacterium Fryx2]|nr:type II toxin-antitoxin system HipA family toxin [Paracoccaceae bacterium Fryx2]
MARGRVARRPRRATRTGVWFQQRRVGTLTRQPDGGMAFSYDPAWMEDERAFPVASSLPLSVRTWRGDAVFSAFDNLLPDAEGDLRDRIAARVGTDGKDVHSLLSVLGRDCVGALQFLPADTEPVDAGMEFRPVTDAEIAADLANLAAAPLALGEDEDFRISIAGAQEKTAYLRVKDQWAKPRGITPTSHIFKTSMGVLPGPDEIDMTDSVDNELYCMTLADEMGLPVARVQKLAFDGTPVLVVERFDRRWDGDTLRRLPQEDLCQCLGIPSARKYQRLGGPGVADVMAVLREADDPAADRGMFFRAQVFFYLIGAPDGHGKNFSLHMGARGRFRLAPLYDILSVAPVMRSGRLQRKRYRLAMAIAGHYGIDEIVPRHYEQEARAAGLPEGQGARILAEMASRIRAGVAATARRVEAATLNGVGRIIGAEATARADMVLALLDDPRTPG